jgi:hypothetical protein
MKIQLLLADNSPRSDFTNIDPFAPPGDLLRKQGNFANLTEFVDDAECEELVALDIIDFLSIASRQVVLDHWITKIRHGGIITIGGLDIVDITRAVSTQQISIGQANLYIYGQQSAPWQHRYSSVDVKTMILTLQEKGLRILKRRTNNFFYMITAERP